MMMKKSIRIVGISVVISSLLIISFLAIGQSVLSLKGKNDRAQGKNVKIDKTIMLSIKNPDVNINTLGFFENCSFNLNKTKTGYDTVKGVGKIEDKLLKLRTIADSLNAPLMYTNCLCGKNTLQTQKNILDGAFIDVKKDEQLDEKMIDNNHYYIHKINYFSKKENLKYKGYEVFRVNENLPVLIQKLGIKRMVVYGNSLDYCTYSTTMGFLKLGIETTVLRDVTGKCHGDAKFREKVLKKLGKNGAIIKTMAEFESQLSNSTN